MGLREIGIQLYTSIENDRVKIGVLGYEICHPSTKFVAAPVLIKYLAIYVFLACAECVETLLSPTSDDDFRLAGEIIY